MKTISGVSIFCATAPPSSAAAGDPGIGLKALQRLSCTRAHSRQRLKHLRVGIGVVLLKEQWIELF